jgi:hypothetical protein
MKSIYDVTFGALGTDRAAKKLKQFQPFYTGENVSKETFSFVEVESIPSAGNNVVDVCVNARSGAIVIVEIYKVRSVSDLLLGSYKCPGRNIRYRINQDYHFQLLLFKTTICSATNSSAAGCSTASSSYGKI